MTKLYTLVPGCDDKIIVPKKCSFPGSGTRQHQTPRLFASASRKNVIVRSTLKKMTYFLSARADVVLLLRWPWPHMPWRCLAWQYGGRSGQHWRGVE